MKAEEFDRKFDDGHDVMDHLDLDNVKLPGLKQWRVNVDFPTWMVEALDREARRLGVTRQSVIKFWIAERLEKDGEEKERYRRVAARAGKSLSEWLRQAAAEKLAGEEPRISLESVEALSDFFAACDAGESGREPDWEAHKTVIDRSGRSGGAVT